MFYQESIITDFLPEPKLRVRHSTATRTCPLLWVEHLGFLASRFQRPPEGKNVKNVKKCLKYGKKC